MNGTTPAGHARAPKYVGVLGACCTADAVRPKVAAAASADLRLLYYQDRTSWLSMSTAPLDAADFELIEATDHSAEAQWRVRMALDEVLKRHTSRMLRDIEHTDVLLMDAVSAFVFPHLVDAGSQRVFVESLEWQRHIKVRIPLCKRRLWDFPIEHCLDKGRQMLAELYARRPRLRVIFHVAQPCFNDAVDFEDCELAAHVEFFALLNERIVSAFAGCFPGFQALRPAQPRADPQHPGGKHPFGYDAASLQRLHRQIAELIYG